MTLPRKVTELNATWADFNFIVIVHNKCTNSVYVCM